MGIGPAYLGEEGLWHAAVTVGHADALLAALDPTAPFVIIEASDGSRDWHEVPVSVGPDEQPRLRLVRRHAFDLLVSPAEAVEVGRCLRAQGPTCGGGFDCYQFRARPSVDFSLPDYARGRADAMRGQHVVLAIDLPHDGHPAVVSSPDEENLEGYRDRFGR